MRRHRGSLAIVSVDRILVVRARGRERFYLPGGIVEAAESTPLIAAVRELEEETSLVVQGSQARFLATVVGPADAAPKGVFIVAHHYWSVFDGDVADAVPRNEIVEVKWVSRSELACVAPVSRLACEMALCLGRLHVQ